VAYAKQHSSTMKMNGFALNDIGLRCFNDTIRRAPTLGVIVVQYRRGRNACNDEEYSTIRNASSSMTNVPSPTNTFIETFLEPIHKIPIEILGEMGVDAKRIFCTRASHKLGTRGGGCVHRARVV